MAICLEHVTSEAKRMRPTHWQGRIVEVGRGTVRVRGLSSTSKMGDCVEIRRSDSSRLEGEILTLLGDDVIVLPDGNLDGIKLNDPVVLKGEISLSPDDSWLGKVLDPNGRSIGDEVVIRGRLERPLKGYAIPATARKPLGPRMETGLALFNTMLPIARGQRIGLFAGSGVGKSTLLGKFVLGIQADVIVVALVGERSREISEFVSRVLGPTGMKRTVVVAATADQSALLRRRCAWSAMTVAEHFRDLGHQVLLVTDSLTRFAEAHREIAVAAGEISGTTGFPPSTTPLLTGLCERAGPGPADQGDITAIFSILVAGSDMEEPLADTVRGILDGHIVLAREIAERGRFPAVDVLRSVSRSLPMVASDAENELISTARKRLGCYAKNEIMIKAGLYSAGADAEIDSAIACYPRLDEFFAAYEPQDSSASFALLSNLLREDAED